MSAFILEEKGFDQLAAELFAHANLQHSKLQWAIQRHLRVDPRESTFDTVEKQIRAFVQNLYAANVSAVNQRYSESTPAPLIRFSEASGLPKWSDEQLFKHLECLSYQCAEGDVPESEIYKRLETLIGAIARSIVGHSDKYEAARWGW